MREPIEPTELDADGAPTRRHVCAACGRVLDYVSGYGWAHAGLREADHPAVPVADTEVPVVDVCDFCSAEETTHVCRVDPIRLAAVTATGAISNLIGSRDDWAACPVCAELITRGRWNEVTRRSLRTMQETTGEEPDADMVQLMKRMHATLRRAMRGLPEPLE